MLSTTPCAITRPLNHPAFDSYPDGQVKLLHLWPPKLLQAGRVNYEAVEEAAAMREAASLSL